jgi:perosamine synthetase
LEKPAKGKDVGGGSENGLQTMNQIPWWSPRIVDEDFSLVAEVLRSNFVNDGEITERFEREIASLVGARHAVAVTSGTAALYLSLKALGVGHGDEVIVPDVTFIATANAVSMTGARAILADVDPETLSLSPEACQQAITPRTRAIMPVHVSGRAGTITEILKLAQACGLPVVEDAAEALLSKHRGRFLGTLGQAGCFSFSPNKTITTGQGGMIVTNDDELHARLRKLKDQGRPVRGTGGADTHESVGFNFKFTNLQAALGLGQLNYLGERTERQKRIYDVYCEELAAVSGITLMSVNTIEGECPQWTDALVDRREALEKFLDQRRIGYRRFWFPLHTQAPYRLPVEQFPNSTLLWPRAIWLASAFQLTDEDVRTVSRTLKEFYGA